MKKTLYILATAALVLSSCDNRIQPDDLGVEDNIVTIQPVLCGGSDTVMPETKASTLVSEDGSICVPLSLEVTDGIGVESSSVTKGSQKNTTTDIKPLSTFAGEFNLAAWLGTKSFIDAYKTVSYTGGAWSLGTKYEWVAGSEPTFYAYANLPESGASVSSSNSTSQTLQYTVPASVSAQTDILMGVYEGPGEYDSTLGKNGVAKLVFYHPLTAVKFKLGEFKDNSGNVIPSDAIAVKKITVNGILAGGTAQMTPTSVTSSDAGARFSWTLISDDTIPVDLGDGSSTLGVDANGFIGEDAGTFLLVPQDLTAFPISFKITATISGSPASLIATVKSGAWEAGKTNIFVLGYTKE